MLTSGGDMDPDKKLRGGWGIAQGLITTMLDFSRRHLGFKSLTDRFNVAAFPYMLVMLVMCFSIFKALEGGLCRNPALDEQNWF